VTARTAEGAATQVLLDASDVWQPDLLAVGSHGRSGFTRFLLGSVSYRLAVGARCSVRVCRNSPAGPPRVLVATDGSPHAAVAVKTVAQRFWPPEAEFLTASVTGAAHLDPSSMEFHEFASMQVAEWEARRRSWAEGVAAEAARLLSAAGLRATPWSGSGEAARTLLERAAAWNATCIFMGAEGAGQTTEALLGSAATAIVQRARCSVEIVRSTRPAGPAA
jgi:nucleotide-binding universal stress UspA family protein